MANKKILIADEDISVCELLRSYLEAEGFSARFAHTAADALDEARNGAPALIILDALPPGFDAFDLCRRIREFSPVPILFLSAKCAPLDRIAGLELGADDYVGKPFDPKEVVARVKAILRRTARESARGEIRYDKLSVNLETYELFVDGVRVDTPPRELELLYHMVKNPNRVFTREQLLDEVWGFEYFGDSRTVDVHIKRLRDKLRNVSGQWALRTVWGVGYKFEVRGGGAA